MRLLAPFALIVLSLGVVIWVDDTPGDANLVFVNQNEVFTLDPQRMSYVQDLRLAHALYEGLVRWNNADFSIVPAAAARMPEISEDALRYTFEIRPDARWSNGDPVTAHDFVWSWQRAILPDTAADYSNMFFAIAGAEEFFAWRSAQTARFMADPFASDEVAEPDDVAAMLARMRDLLAADDLPAGVARPGPGVEAELDRLESAVRHGNLAGLERDLRDSALVRAWQEGLGAPASRAAEARWMWERAERKFAEFVRIRVAGDRTLEVELRQPTAYFLDLQCFGVFFPVHRPTVEGWPDTTHPEGWHAAGVPPLEERQGVALTAATGKIEQRHDWAKPGRHVGNGTHRLVEWRYKRDLRLAANPLYHDRERVRSDSILVRTIEDTNTAVLAFESGHVDWLADVATEYQTDMLEQLDAYKERHREQLRALMDAGLAEDEALAQLPEPGPGERRDIHVFPTFGTEFYSFNCRENLGDARPNPFRLAAVRRAFCQSVDKREIVERVTRLDEPVATTLIPRGSIQGYASPAGLPYDPEAARRELREAGWDDRDDDGFVEDAEGRPFPVVDLLYTTNIPRYKWISLNLKSQWERELGVRVQLRASETKFYREDLKQGDFMIARGRWYGDYGDPTTFLDLCRTGDGNNDRKYSNPEVDALLARAAGERDPVARMRTLEECERLLFDEEVPILVLCQLVQVYMYESGKVHGLSDHPRLTQYLWQMKVDHR